MHKNFMYASNRLILEIALFDSAGTKLEATSPETDTPTRFRAEICYWLYQDLG